MQSLTQNEDVDVKIINSLNLDDLRNVCSTNQYTSYLCNNHIDLKFKIKNIKDKVDETLKLINKTQFFIPTNGQNFGIFHQLLTNMKMAPADEYIELLLNSEEIDTYTIYTMIIQKFSFIPNLYSIVFTIGETTNSLYKNIETISYNGSEDEIKEFLLHIYYDEML